MLRPPAGFHQGSAGDAVPSCDRVAAPRFFSVPASNSSNRSSSNEATFCQREEWLRVRPTLSSTGVVLKRRSPPCVLIEERVSPWNPSAGLAGSHRGTPCQVDGHRRLELPAGSLVKGDAKFSQWGRSTCRIVRRVGFLLRLITLVLVHLSPARFTPLCRNRGGGLPGLPDDAGGRVGEREG